MDRRKSVEVTTANREATEAAEVICRWCGAEARPSRYLNEWHCQGCFSRVYSCSCPGPAVALVGPEINAIVPIHPWP